MIDENNNFDKSQAAFPKTVEKYAETSLSLKLWKTIKKLWLYPILKHFKFFRIDTFPSEANNFKIIGFFWKFANVL